MTDYITPELEEALRAARKQAMAKSARLRVMVGDAQFPILKLSEHGFALDVEDAPHLRGLVDVYDGAKHLMHCLVIAAEEDGDVMHYEFKRATAAHDAPPLDYVRAENAPVALIASR